MMIIIILLLILLLFVPISIRVIHDNNYNDIDVYLFSFIRHKFDLDNFIRKFILDDNSKISLRTIVNNLEIALSSKKIIKEICNKTKIKKCTIILKEDYDNILRFLTFWNIVSRISYIIKKNFKDIKNEYYMITDSTSELNIEIIFKINLWKVLFILLRNLKELKIINKIRRRQKKSGTSNM